MADFLEQQVGKRILEMGITYYKKHFKWTNANNAFLEKLNFHSLSFLFNPLFAPVNIAICTPLISHETADNSFFRGLSEELAIGDLTYSTFGKQPGPIRLQA